MNGTRFVSLLPEADSNSADLREMLRVPVSLRGMSWLRRALQAAIKLEFVTLPPYLTAYWSLKHAVTTNQARQKDDLARNTASKHGAVGDFHNIYINPHAFDHFLKTEQFPQKAVLVMDVYEAKRKEPPHIVDRGHFEGQQRRIEVVVKNKDCPDGLKTDWAYYVFTDDKPAKAFPNATCYDCHKEYADTDNVWTQFYPILRDK